MDDKIGPQASQITRADGGTKAEKYLKQLGDKTFLSLWSHAGIYRDQGNGEGGHGKEVCDLLVVFDNHIIIFSDKDINYPESNNPIQNWCRWYRRAIESSVKQVRGAERWIRKYPKRLFLDRACTQPFPIRLPAFETAKFHRILVAHDAARCCKRDQGGSGSLLIRPAIVGNMHFAPKAGHSQPNQAAVQPYAIGRVDSENGYIHVLDDTSLDILLTTCDTITDFANYLSKKEALIEANRLISAPGEEDLLAYYLNSLNESGEHDFVLPPDCNVLTIQEGTWARFVQSPERKSQIEADRISYHWDHLIEKFTRSFFEGTFHHCSHPTYRDQEWLLRFFARESRFNRRYFCESLAELQMTKLQSGGKTRVMPPRRNGDTYYIFAIMSILPNETEDEYRSARLKFVKQFCEAAKLNFPDAPGFMCLATEPATSNFYRSEDAIYVDCSNWTPERETTARAIQKAHGFFTDVTQSHRHPREYPVTAVPDEILYLNFNSGAKSMRNSPCSCGSGKKTKKCCGLAYKL